MKRLTPVGGVPTPLDRFESIRNKKHLTTRAQLLAVHDTVVLRYGELAQAIAATNLASLQTNSAALQATAVLRACYSGATQPLRDLKAAIRDAQQPRVLKYCPMCGTTRPGTHDHYLPAIRFPEFSVHPLNLIPCCSTCNSIKDDDWLSSAGERQYLHGFLDDLPDFQFVHVALHERLPLRGVGATFSLQAPIGLDAHLWSLIDSHFRRLHLVARYNELGNDEVDEIISDCRVHVQEGGTNARNFLHGRAHDRRNVYGRNNWLAVLMEAIAQHPNFPIWVGNP